MSPMMRKILLPVLAIAVGVAGTVVIVMAKPEAKRVQPPQIVPAVEVMTAQRGEHVFRVIAQGTVEPRTASALVAEVAGRIVRVSDSFVEGGFFEADETLVWLDDRDYRAAVAQAEAQVAQAQLALAREEEEARVAREEWERFEREGEPSALVLREPQMAQARAALAAAKAQRDRAERDLARTRLRAPYTGRIHAKMVDVGDFLQPGAPAADVYAVDYAEVRLPLFDRDLAFLDLPLGRRDVDDAGQPRPAATVLGTFAGERHSWDGVVQRTEGEIDPRTRMVHVVVRVADPYGRAAAKGGVPLAVGMFVDVEIEGRRVEDVTVVPRNALLSGDRIGVVVDGRLHLRDAKVLRATREQAVLSEGVNDGEQVLLTRLDTLVDGMTVRIVDEASDGSAR